jgi:tRNA-dihydrouridine synthase B
MLTGFWKDLKLPIIGLAPMDGVTDGAFRHIAAKYGRPDILFTEFTSVEGIRAGAERLMDDFYFSEIERPVVAQLFGADPTAFFLGAVVASALGFDGIDINMGCPAKNITQKGAGASLILDPERAKQIVLQTKAGAKAWAEGIHPAAAGVPENIIALLDKHQPFNRRELPISVKTRLGFDSITITDWVKHLLEVEPVAITIHGRTLKQLYTGEANWEAICQGSAVIHTTNTLALGNGDLMSYEDAKSHIQQYGVDGALVGRAAFGNPWLFQNREAGFEERMQVALEHARYLHSIFPGKGFVRIRKHLMDYCKGVEGAKELRMQLMKVSSLEEVEAILAPLTA